MFNPETNTFDLTPALEMEIRLMRNTSPFRIVWLCNDLPDNKVSVYASHTRRQMLKAVREGFVAAIVK